ncbi:type II toxin-antitoxin system death-on-curing family toxin [Candidatus Uhrbacteria bacterium]|nr:type II toxin-antitoxin system death-on-curing family toxin [Candidatus Uhrbacteria bacterium]
MNYLRAEDILVIHSEIIDQTGGLHGVRDVGFLASIINKPQTKFSGKELYAGKLKKAAVYLESIAKYHVFFDGNKRTSIITAARFLFINGLELAANNLELENFVLRVVTNNLSIDEIAKWFKKHSFPL